MNPTETLTYGDVKLGDVVVDGYGTEIKVTSIRRNYETKITGLLANGKTISTTRRNAHGVYVRRQA